MLPSNRNRRLSEDTPKLNQSKYHEKGRGRRIWRKRRRRKKEGGEGGRGGNMMGQRLWI